MAYTNINFPADYFNTLLYTGTGASNARTGVGFQPDWVWIKERNASADHGLYDAVRGVTKQLESNTTTAETTEATGLTAFGTDGFTVGALAQLNTSGDTYVAWNWLGANTTVSNTAGTITSTVSANTTSGFSIVSYTGNNTAGATVGHGLSSTPQLIIIKNRDSAVNWNSYHEPLGNQAYLRLNTTGSASTGASIWNNTSPTSSVFTLGSGFDAVNGSGNSHIAYCFAEVKGYSKFGSYTGNGSADGTFVYTGFKPAFLIVKRYNDAGYDWLMYDNKRQVSFNVVDDFLKPNLADAETTGNANQSLDFLSNGVKFRGNGASSNGSGASYIYMCFAENPFTTSTGIPTTAR
jgi:hypothetical protein